MRYGEIAESIRPNRTLEDPFFVTYHRHVRHAGDRAALGSGFGRQLTHRAAQGTGGAAWPASGGAVGGALRRLFTPTAFTRCPP